MPFLFDAPLIELQDTADITDLYLYLEPDTDPGGDPPTGAVGSEDDYPFLDVIGAGAGVDSDPFLDDEDEFLFSIIGAAPAGAAPDGSTPAPPVDQPAAPQEPRYDPARHSALMATIRNSMY